MKRIVLAFTLVTLLVTSCTTDADDNTIEGIWTLTEWNISEGFDIDGDGVTNRNILNEIECVNNETLVFESNGTVTSKNTFNPNITIALLNGTSNDYVFDVACDEIGVISFASTFTINGNQVLINDGVATLNGDTLSCIFVDAIKIYNEAYTEVVATKDLILVYTHR
ncbi:hypothetical protein [Mariniflexile sp.]|uniref:hypothetical protein n=1 Tax=Mariniflexile sp. TaxID=1979402 RepID=UPI003564BA27